MYVCKIAAVFVEILRHSVLHLCSVKNPALWVAWTANEGSGSNTEGMTMPRRARVFT
jgi:hypothetical protein